ncbi:GNAT family N-acetyltransferase [Nostoc sp. DSM 114161]|jgi:amino-acid N-acetyltransferase|uniref:GNAT family N-acetyltransferase n=1 Tax=Nostoc sp. DSM 114161 TaxID=3440143 RepID=UPI0040458FB6
MNNTDNYLLPLGYVIRQAKPSDMWLICLFIIRASLDASQLKWHQFWVIEYDGRLVAFGQLRNFEFAQELGSLFVVPTHRNQGLGTFLIQHLIAQSTQPLYLKCLKNKLGSFYAKKGFIPISYEELPVSLKSKFRLSQLRKTLLKAFVLFMKYEHPV